MGYGKDEPIDHNDDQLDINRPLTGFEKMLRYHEMTADEFYECSHSQQSRLRWNYKKFGKDKGG